MADLPVEMQQIGKEMESVQNEVEKKLRPMIRDQFVCMADVMKDQYAESQQIQRGLGDCQKSVAQVQSKLDEAVQGFGMAMQTGMGQCQQHAQAAMESGQPESAAQAAFMDCAKNVAATQLTRIPALKLEISRILNNL